MADVRDVAAAVLDFAKSTDVDTRLTAKKLQKLVYYAQAWHLVDFGTPLFADPIQAWAEGPVVRRLWDIHRGAYFVNSYRFGSAENLSANEQRLVAEVVDRYGRLSAERLSDLTHTEPPWCAAREGLDPSDRSDVEINLDSIRDAYRRGRIRPEVAAELAIADNRLEGLGTSLDAAPYLLAVARGELGVEEAIKERLAAVLS